MKVILLSGMDPIRNLAKLQKKLDKREKKEGERYLWDMYKALIPLISSDGLGKPTTCIDIVTQNILNAERITDGVIVVGRSDTEYDLRPHLPEGFHFVQQGNSFADNLVLGYEAVKRFHGLNQDEHVLVLNGDLPKATGLVLDDMINSQSDFNADFVMSCVQDNVLPKEYERNYVSVIDDYFGNGEIANIKESNFFFVNGHADLRAIGGLYEFRKLKDPRTWPKFGKSLGQELSGKEIGNLAIKVAHYLIADKLDKWGIKSIKESDLLSLSYTADTLSKVVHTKTTLIQNLWPGLQKDMDSWQDIARLGFKLYELRINRITS